MAEQDLKVTSQPVTIAAVAEEEFPTSFTYLDPEGSGKPVEMAGVFFVPGEEVDLSEVLGGAQLKHVAQKLANNPFFSSEGGEALEEVQKREAKRSELAMKAAQAQDKRLQESKAVPNAPEDYVPPKVGLETQAGAPRRGPARG